MLRSGRHYICILHTILTLCWNGWRSTLKKKILEDENAWANIYNRHGQNTTRGLPASHKRKWPERCLWNWLKANIEHEATKGNNRVTQQQLNFIKGSINAEV